MKKGFSLLELILVLGIIAALIVVAFVTYPSVKRNYMVNNISKNIVGAKAIVKELYASTGQYDQAGLNSQYVRNLAFPSNTYNSKNSGAAYNDYGGTYKLTSQSYMMAFDITINKIPQDACIQLASSLYPSFEMVLVNSKTIYRNNAGAYQTNIAFDMSAVSSGCSGDSNTMQFFTYS